MMEKFVEDARKWERRHQETWIGEHLGPSWFGTGLSMQADLMSPLGMVDFVRNPSAMNLAKAMYTPTIAYGGYSFTSWLTGTKIGFAERVLHSADMTRQLGRSVMSTWGGHASKAIRAIPGLVGLAALATVGYFGNLAYAELSGSEGIGDLSGWTA